MPQQQKIEFALYEAKNAHNTWFFQMIIHDKEGKVLSPAKRMETSIVEIIRRNGLLEGPFTDENGNAYFTIKQDKNE